MERKAKPDLDEVDGNLDQNTVSAGDGLYHVTDVPPPTLTAIFKILTLHLIDRAYGTDDL
jgi:hypothetical protein